MREISIRALACLVVLALPLVSVPAAAQRVGEGDSDAAPLAPAAVLWDQPSAGGSYIASSFWQPLGSGVYCADDFSNAVGWSIDTIFVDGSSPISSILDYNWYIYPDAAGQPAGYPGDGLGTEVFSLTLGTADPAVTVTDFGGDIELDVVAATGGPLSLPAGTWWLTFYPSVNTSDWFDRWNWREAPGSLSDYHIINPDNLFGWGYTTWTPEADTHLAFRLEGMLQEEYEGGDAPDSRNHFGVGMTTYPSPVAANFPTVWDPGLALGSNGHGLCHTYPLGNSLFLGNALSLSLETDADLLPDADTVTNIDPPTNAADRDGFDDGTAFAPGTWNQCQPIAGIQVTASGAGVVNIWVDWGRNGDWSDGTTACNCGENEWAAQNVAVPGAGTYVIGSGALGEPPILACQPGLANGAPLQADVWMRTTLTPVVLDDVNFDALYAVGGQSTGCFEEGETEDRYVTFGPNAVTLSASAAQPSRVPAIMLVALAVVVPAGGMVLLRRRR